MKLLKNKELKYKFEKNKNKILTIAIVIMALITLCIVGIGIYINRPLEAPPDEQVSDEIVQEADYIINGNKEGDISLIKVKDNKTINSLKLSKDTIYSRSNDLDYIMAFTDNTFYKILENKEVLEKEEVAKSYNNKPISFKFSDKYIVTIEDNGISIISLESKKISNKDILNIEKYVVYSNYLIYTSNNNIYSLNMDTGEEKSIDIGDSTKALFVSNGKIVAFNNFGSGNNSNIIVRFKPDNLYLEKEYTHNNNDISPLTSDSDDLIIPYIDNSNMNNLSVNTHYRINIDKDGGNKRQITLPSVQDDNLFNEDNSVSTKGYMYSTKNNNLEITSFESQKVIETINDYKEGFFMPILK